MFGLDKKTVASGLALPDLCQIGIVVRDISAAIRHYRGLGVDPWYRPRHGRGGWVKRHGRTIDATFDIALAYTGSIQLELIEPTGGPPTIYTEHLVDHGEGLHHLGFCVANLDARLVEADRAGIGVLQSGLIVSAGGAKTRYAYLDTAETGGIILELIETKLLGIPVGMSPAMMRLGKITGDVERATA